MLKETAIKYRAEEYDLNAEYANVKRCTLMIETGAEILDNIILKEKHN